MLCSYQGGNSFLGGGGIKKTFKGISTTFSRPIPTMFYHVRECLWHHTKTINGINIVLLTAVT